MYIYIYIYNIKLLTIVNGSKSIIRPIPLLTLWISEGLAKA